MHDHLVVPLLVVVILIGMGLAFLAIVNAAERHRQRRYERRDETAARARTKLAGERAAHWTPYQWKVPPTPISDLDTPYDGSQDDIEHRGY